MLRTHHAVAALSIILMFSLLIDMPAWGTMWGIVYVFFCVHKFRYHVRNCRKLL